MKRRGFLTKAVVFLLLVSSTLSWAGTKGNNGAATDVNLKLDAEFTATVPVYRADGQPGVEFTEIAQNISLPQQTYCFDTRTLLSSSPQLCTSTTPSFSRLNVPAAPQLGFKYHTKCESAHIDLSFISPDLDFPQLTFPGALALHTDVSVGGTIPVSFFGRTINLPIPLISVLNDQALGYVLRGKNQDDVQNAAASLAPLLTDPATVQSLMGENGFMGGLLDANGNLSIDLANLSQEQLQQIQQQIEQVWPFIKVVSPVFLPPLHAYNDQCRTSEEREYNVKFGISATLVDTGSGNQQLNFKAWTPLGNFFEALDANIHYQVNDKKGNGSGITRAQGILLSRTAEFFIDLSQLDSSPGNLLDHLLNGGSVPVNACMTFLPWKCVSSDLKLEF